MSNELFVELNDQQQELVSGGISFDEYVDSDYSLDFMKTDSAVVNGPGGSASLTKTYDLDLDSSIYKDLGISV
jgi:hypothetical protein